MKDKPWKKPKLLIAILGFLLAIGSADAGQDELRSLIERGFTHIYDLEYQEAEKVFEQAIALYPDHPSGYLYLATNIWLRELAEGRELTFEQFVAAEQLARRPRRRKVDPALEQRFRQLIDTAIEKAESKLEANERDAESLYLLGTAHGTLAGFEATVSRKFFSALRNGSKAFDYHKKVVELDPTFYDSYLTIGMYDYIAGSLPRTVKWLAFLFGFRGNKERGLLEIQLAAEKGRYNSKDAKVMLTVLSIREKRPLVALKYLSELHKLHPKNYLIHLDLAALHHLIKNHAEAIRLYQQALAKISASEPHYEQLGAEQVHYRLGELYLEMGRAEQAIESYNQVLAANSPPEDMVTIVHLRLGQAYDLAKNRERAVEHYKVVLAREDINDSQDLARRYLKRPYDRSQT